MKRKLLSILALAALTMVTQGAWATELPGKATLAFSLATTGSLGTATGTENTYSKNGTIVYDENNGDKKITPGETDSDAWSFKSTTSYIKVELANALQAGDVVVINAKYASGSGSSNKFRICDDIANNSGSGISGHGSEIVVGGSLANRLVVLETGNGLIGKKVFYLGWCSSTNSGAIASIKVYQSDAPSTVSATKTWDYNNTYDAPSTATAYQTVNDGMYYSPGISFSSQAEFTGNLLNIQSSGKNDDTMSESTSKYLKFYVPAGAVQLTVNAIPYGDSNKTLYCKVGDQEAEGKEAKGKSSTTELTFATKYTTDVTPVYLYAKGTGSLYYIQDIKLTFTPAPTVTLDDYGYATFASTYPLDLANMSATTAPTAYKAAISTNTVNFTAVSEAVAANTGILLLGGANETVTIPIAASGTDISATNAFEVNTGGTTFTGTDGYTYFGMKKNQATLTFAPFTPSTVAIPSNKAYLKVLTSTLANGLTFVFDDENTTGVKTIDNRQLTTDNYYDLQGRRVPQPTRGLYIVNGKKVVIK